jgi:hypothetical protein
VLPRVSKGTGRDGTGREGKGREGKGREGKGRDGKGREGKGRDLLSDIVILTTTVIVYKADLLWLHRDRN